MRRIATVTQAVAFIVTGALVLFAVALLATKHDGPPRAAIPELTLLAVAIVAFLLAAKPYVDADAGDPPAPVEVRLSDPQVDLMAQLIDSLVLRAGGHHPGVRPIPNGVSYPSSSDGVMLPPQVRETRLPRKRGARHASPK